MHVAAHDAVCDITRDFPKVESSNPRSPSMIMQSSSLLLPRIEIHASAKHCFRVHQEQEIEQRWHAYVGVEVSLAYLGR